MSSLSSSSSSSNAVHLTAYVQGDWVSSKNVDNIGFKSDDTTVDSYDIFLNKLTHNGVKNLATWHENALGVLQGDGQKKKYTDVLRNNRQINEADCVISRLVRLNPDSKHWGSLACMAYAVGRGKPCYIIADPNCVIFKSHFIWHPLIRKFYSEEDFFNFINTGDDTRDQSQLV